MDEKRYRIRWGDPQHSRLHLSISFSQLEAEEAADRVRQLGFEAEIIEELPQSDLILTSSGRSPS